MACIFLSFYLLKSRSDCCKLFVHNCCRRLVVIVRYTDETWNVERGTWNVERGTWNVERGTRNRETGTWNAECEICNV